MQICLSVYLHLLPPLLNLNHSYTYMCAGRAWWVCGSSCAPAGGSGSSIRWSAGGRWGRDSHTLGQESWVNLLWNQTLNSVPTLKFLNSNGFFFSSHIISNSTQPVKTVLCDSHVHTFNQDHLLVQMLTLPQCNATHCRNAEFTDTEWKWLEDVWSVISAHSCTLFEQRSPIAN